MRLRINTIPLTLFSLTACAGVLTVPARAQFGQNEAPYRWTVGGHTGNPDYGYEELALSPNGKLLATASPDGTIKIWDAKTTQLLRTISTDATSLYCVAFSPDGAKIAAGGSTYIAVPGNAGFNGAVSVYDVASGDQIANLPTTRWDITVVAFSPDGTQLVDAGYLHNSSTSLDEGKIETYRIADHTLLKTMDTAERIGKLAYLPDRQTLLAAGYHYDYTTNQGTPVLQRWNPVTGILLKDLPTKLNYARGLAFSPDKTTFAVCGGNAAGMGTIELWNSATLKLQSTLTGKLAYIDAVTFDATGKNILGGGYKDVYDATYDLTYHRGAVELWGVNGQRSYTSGILTQSLINAVAFDPNGKTFCASSNDLDVNRYATSDASVQGAFTRIHNGVNTVAVCDVNDTLAVQDIYGTLAFYSACTGKPLPAPPRTTGFNRFVPNSANMVFLDGGAKKQIKIIQPDGATAFAVTSQLSVVVDVAFSPDGTLAAVMGISKAVNNIQYKSVEIFRVSDWQRQRQINAFAFAAGEVSQGIDIAAAFSSNNQQIAIGVDGLDATGSSTVGSLTTCNVQNGKPLATTNLAALHPTDTALYVIALAFSPDGKRVLMSESASNYKTLAVSGAVQTYDANLKLIHRLDTPETISSMKLSPSGEHLIFGGYTLDTNTGRRNGILTALNIYDGTVALRYDDQLGTGVNSLDFRGAGGSLLYVARPDATFGAITLPCFNF